MIAKGYDARKIKSKVYKFAAEILIFSTEMGPRHGAGTS